MNLLFDIGGSKIRIARAASRDTFDTPVVIPTPQKFDEAMVAIRETVRSITKGSAVEYAVGGLPGVRDVDGNLFNWTNVPDWEGKPIASSLKEAFGAQMLVLQNDASVVGLGEAAYGAGKGYHIVAYVTISTGVGGGKIVDCKIDPSSIGFEPGHQLIDGRDGAVELESVVSGRSIHKRFGKHPRDISKDDPIWRELAKPLAQGLHNIRVTWSPDVFVLGGSMIIGDPAISIDAIEKEFLTLPHIFPKQPIIKKAELGDFGGLYGALKLIESNVNN